MWTQIYRRNSSSSSHCQEVVRAISRVLCLFRQILVYDLGLSRGYFPICTGEQICCDYAQTRGWTSRFYEGCGLGERNRRSPPKQREPEVSRDNENAKKLSSGDNIELQL
jgi:hypothetical protein